VLPLTEGREPSVLFILFVKRYTKANPGTDSREMKKGHGEMRLADSAPWMDLAVVGSVDIR
jgi:hypothetical protein